MHESHHGDTFERLYSRDEPAYGMASSPELAAFLDQCPRQGRAVDLGAGAGRNTLALAARGLDVLAIDLSAEGLKQLRAAAAQRDLAGRIETQQADVCDLAWRRRARIIRRITVSLRSRRRAGEACVADYVRCLRALLSNRRC